MKGIPLLATLAANLSISGEVAGMKLFVAAAAAAAALPVVVLPPLLFEAMMLLFVPST